nr:hypothetical protein BaRGS_009183 [Batillaria attramentaria]
MVETFGVIRPNLIQDIRQILTEYPDNGQILKEMIQNAEDARAKTVKIVTDRRDFNRNFDVPTGLPVHVNGYFALSQNRNHLKWPDQLRHREHFESSVKWNLLLAEVLLPKAYAHLLEWLPHGVPVNPQQFYGFWPDMSTVTEHFRPLAERLYQDIANRRAFFTEANGGQWIALSQSILSQFPHELEQAFQQYRPLFEAIGVQEDFGIDHGKYVLRQIQEETKGQRLSQEKMNLVIRAAQLMEDEALRPTDIEVSETVIQLKLKDSRNHIDDWLLVNRIGFEDIDEFTEEQLNAWDKEQEQGKLVPRDHCLLDYRLENEFSPGDCVAFEVYDPAIDGDGDDESASYIYAVVGMMMQDAPTQLILNLVRRFVGSGKLSRTWKPRGIVLMGNIGTGATAFNYIARLDLDEQALEKALKAVMYNRDANQVSRDHELCSLASRVGDSSLSKLANRLQSIVGEHTRMRYPDVCQYPKIPAEVYDNDAASVACDLTEQSLTRCI